MAKHKQSYRRKVDRMRAWHGKFVHPARLQYGELRAFESRIGVGKYDVMVLERGDPCYLCNGPRQKRARDHIEPYGSRYRPNFSVPCCDSCNSAKADRPLLLYLARRARRRALLTT